MTREWEQHMDMMESAEEAKHNGECVKRILQEYAADSLSHLAGLLRSSYPSKPWVKVRMANGGVRDADEIPDDADLGEVCGLIVGAEIPDVTTTLAGGNIVEGDWVWFEDCDNESFAAQMFCSYVDWVEENTFEQWAEYHWYRR